MILGDGNNTFMAMRFDNSTAKMGDGDNIFQAFMLTQNSSATMGEGNNTVQIDYMSGNSSAVMGNGNNDIYVHGVQNNASVSVGNGDNIIQINYAQNTENIHLGSGNNAVVIASSKDSSSSYIKDGSVYTQAELDQMTESERDAILGVIEDIDQRRAERNKNGQALAAESASTFNAFMNEESFIRMNKERSAKLKNFEKAEMMQAKVHNPNDSFSDLQKTRADMLQNLSASGIDVGNRLENTSTQTTHALEKEFAKKKERKASKKIENEKMPTSIPNSTQDFTSQAGNGMGSVSYNSYSTSSIDIARAMQNSQARG